MKFNEGDKVKCVISYGSIIPVGMTGIVVDITRQNIGVSWDGLERGHDCNGLTRKGSGYYVNKENIELIEPTEYHVPDPFFRKPQ